METQFIQGASMTRPRAELICPEETLFYHCVCRCVRRAFLFGKDPYTDKDYSHRKGWIIERLKLLSEVFTIDLCAYAVMSNHYHLVLRLSPDKAILLNDREVVTRWTRVYSGNPTVNNLLAGKDMLDTEKEEAQRIINQWRARLADISWYMRSLNEQIACDANKEDGCTGRFWQGRFKSQAILDEAGLLASMAYVDLNPLRAGSVELPEDAVDISIASRLKELRSQSSTKTEDSDTKPPVDSHPPLLPFASEQSATTIKSSQCDQLPCTLTEYIELIDWLGRIDRTDDKHTLPKDTPPILSRLNIDTQSLASALAPGQLSKGSTIGKPESRRAFARSMNKVRLFGPNLASAA